ATTGKLDAASLVLFDDFSEFQLGACAFPVLDRQFRRAALADLLAIRFQKHSQHHHELPVGDVVLGKTVSAEQREGAFRAISEHLNVPIFRAAFLSSYAPETRHWEYADHNSESESEQRRCFISGLTDFLRTNLESIPRRRLGSGNATTFVSYDLAHFCSFVVNPNLIERVVARFDVIQGFPNSVPLPARRIRESGKRVIFVPTLQPDGRSHLWGRSSPTPVSFRRERGANASPICRSSGSCMATAPTRRICPMISSCHSAQAWWKPKRIRSGMSPTRQYWRVCVRRRRRNLRKSPEPRRGLDARI